MTYSRKLTDEQVRKIRSSHESARALAERYGVSHPTILHVREGSTYSHVTDDEDDPIVGGIHNNAYVLDDTLDFLSGLPDGYCRTVVTSPPEAVLRHGARDTDGPLPLPYRHYLEEQRAVIAECIRVAGDRGIVLYHHRPRFAMGHLDMGYYLTAEFPLRGIIIWHYKKPRFSAGTRNKRQLPNAYDMIFMFTGRHWTLPEKISEEILGWGDVWEIGLDRESRRFLPRLPNELADRCIALGKGRVLDPHAGSGATVLAAIRAGRNWLACDTDPESVEVFQQRRSILEQHDSYFSRLRDSQ